MPLPAAANKKISRKGLALRKHVLYPAGGRAAGEKRMDRKSKKDQPSIKEALGFQP